MVIVPESSIQISASASTPAFCTSFWWSELEPKPRRKLERSTRASDESSRSASARLVISREKNATLRPWSTAALRAMFSASAVFPMLGRDATTTSSPAWSPPVFSSRSLKPVGTPVSSPLRSISIST